MAQSLQRGNAPSNGATGSSSANAGANGSATTGAAASTDSNKDIPRDARIIGLILASLGVTDAEPGVVAMLLEFAHRYTLEILQDAQVYADHAQRPRDPTAASSTATSNLELDDLRMAANSKLEHSYSSPLPKEFLLPLAAQINRVPLPILPESYGIRLPHERDRLTAINWDLAPVTERRTYPEEVSDARDDGASGSTSQANPAAGPGGVNGSHTGASGMDLDMAGDNLFGGRGDEDEDEDDEDDDDDEDMEEVVDTSLQQTDRAQSKDQEDADADEDAEEDDAEEEEDDDDDNGDDDDDDDDAEGQDDS